MNIYPDIKTGKVMAFSNGKWEQLYTEAEILEARKDAFAEGFKAGFWDGWHEDVYNEKKNLRKIESEFQGYLKLLNTR